MIDRPGHRRHCIGWLAGVTMLVISGPALAKVGGSGLLSCAGDALPTPSASAQPAPATMPSLQHWQGGQGYWTLTAHTRIVVEPAHQHALRALAAKLSDDLVTVTGRRPAVRVSARPRPGDIALGLAPCRFDQRQAIGGEGYTLRASRVLWLRANTARGDFYATRSLLQMLSMDASDHARHRRVPHGYALDFPRYSERAVMLDVGRKFAPVPFLKAYLRFMGWYKLNTLHLHLNDQVQSEDGKRWLSRAFRLKSDDPRFAALVPADGKFYTRQDWESLEKVAAANGVRIVPEIDAPGHAGAFVMARPDLAYHGDQPGGGTLDPRKPGSLAYVESVWSQFLPWFHSALVHIGGDEVNINHGTLSTAIQVDFLNRLGHFLQRRGKQVELWGSADFAPTLDHSFVIQRWINWGQEAKVNWGREGFQWTESYGDWYIVPLGPKYFNPHGIQGKVLYDGWDSRTAADTPGRFGPDGGQICVWNDLGTRDYTYAGTVHDLLKGAIPAAGQVFWSDKARAPDGHVLDYAPLQQRVRVLQYGPRVHAFADDPLR
ncbi:family 20 glycosylhydrolase [Oleiagrimonas sp. C23AA]|uniref:family 20 glycosylhydrolase n=1 Tax=Oleiagrimonas sp. C23AA TaxID=2719047 RepID=UPI0014238182|nr:family 20 glycosylhydrolase [Oleiagrimonas sp. C23AA]NII11221.1 family 20 glycosylhydrolase [Oleiagrimonas sp. C23AA]